MRKREENKIKKEESEKQVAQMQENNGDIHDQSIMVSNTKSKIERKQELVERLVLRYISVHDRLNGDKQAFEPKKQFLLKTFDQNIYSNDFRYDMKSMFKGDYMKTSFIKCRTKPIERIVLYERAERDNKRKRKSIAEVISLTLRKSVSKDKDSFEGMISPRDTSPRPKTTRERVPKEKSPREIPPRENSVPLEDAEPVEKTVPVETKTTEQKQAEQKQKEGGSIKQLSGKTRPAFKRAASSSRIMTNSFEQSEPEFVNTLTDLNEVDMTSLTPVELAEKITIYDFKRFYNIPLEEFYKTDSDKIKQYNSEIEALNKLINHVMVTKKMITKFIKVITELLKINSFNMAYHIYSIIETREIHCRDAFNSVRDLYKHKLLKYREIFLKPYSSQYNEMYLKAEGKSKIPVVVWVNNLIIGGSELKNVNEQGMVDVIKMNKFSKEISKIVESKECKYHYHKKGQKKSSTD